MSPRAAWRLESLGFREVYDYPEGKLDWRAAGLPLEGTDAQLPRAGVLADPDPPTCGLSDRVGEVRSRTEAAGWDVCVVVNDQRVVLGLLRPPQLARPDDETAEQAMRPGPSTFRPYVRIDELAQVMIDHDLKAVPITTSDGRLVGVLRQDVAARAALELHQRLHHAHEEGDAESGGKA